MAMSNELYHERINRLLEGAKRLHESVQTFADNVENYQIAPTHEAPVIDAQALANDISVNFDDVKQASQETSQIIDGIDIDALLADASSNDLAQ